jgi:hypothetical protein
MNASVIAALTRNACISHHRASYLKQHTFPVSPSQPAPGLQTDVGFVFCVDSKTDGVSQRASSLKPVF